VVLDAAMASGQRLSHPWLPLAAAALVASVAAGCQPDCGDKQTIRYEHGMTSEDRTAYWTTPPTGPLLHFPPQRIYLLVHGLRADPTHVDINLSFLESGEKQTLSPSSGNQSLWHTREKGIIWLKNDSCAEFYVHAFASTDLPPDPSDAGSD
jgi:hypothetical protein